MFCPGGRNSMGCFVWGGKNGMGCFVQGDKNCMGCFVRSGKTMRDVLSGVSKIGMGFFVPGCFVLHSFYMGPCIHRIGPNHRIGPDRARNWPIPLLN